MPVILQSFVYNFEKQKTTVFFQKLIIFFFFSLYSVKFSYPKHCRYLVKLSKAICITSKCLKVLNDFMRYWHLFSSNPIWQSIQLWKQQQSLKLLGVLQTSCTCLYSYLLKCNLAVFANQRCVKLPKQRYKVNMNAMNSLLPFQWKIRWWLAPKLDEMLYLWIICNRMIYWNKTQLRYVSFLLSYNLTIVNAFWYEYSLCYLRCTHVHYHQHHSL